MPRPRLCGATCVTSSPPMRTTPASGVTKPAIISSVVVLPEPEGPSSEKNSPAAMVASTPATTVSSP